MKKLTISSLLLFATLCSGGSKPNILMIMVDDLGYGDLSSYGATDLKTPHIDKLVTSGMRFDNFYANCPVCSPTRAAFLTGRFQDLVGVPGVIRTYDQGNWGFLDPNAITLPDMMKKAGYETALIGKWHLGLKSPNTPNQRGFDFFHGFLGDMMDDYYHHRRHNQDYMRLNDQLIKPEGHATDIFTQWSIDYLKEKQPSEKPWFLFLSYNAPHTPIQPPKAWLEKVKKREPGLTEKRAKLVSFIEHLDDGIGKVMTALRETGATDDTVIVFTSDNGGQLAVGANNGPWRGGKTMVYEGGLRVAACVVWPGRIQPGSRTDFRALTMDLYPTLCEVAGADIDHAIDGRSLYPTLIGEKQTALPRDEVFVWLQGFKKEAFRRGDWKLLRDKDRQPFELYNLKTDPGEKNNLAKTHPEKFKDLMEGLEKHRKAANAVVWKRPGQK